VPAWRNRIESIAAVWLWPIVLIEHSSLPEIAKTVASATARARNHGWKERCSRGRCPNAITITETIAKLGRTQ